MQQNRKMSDEGVKAFGEYADATMFVIPKDKLPKTFDVKTAFHAALNCFSPKALNVPNGWYAEMLIHKCDEFTLTHMNLLKQILPQATGRAMGIMPRQYSAYIAACDMIFYDYSLVWNAAIERFEAEYPAPTEESKESATVIDISKGAAAQVVGQA